MNPNPEETIIHQKLIINSILNNDELTFRKTLNSSPNLDIETKSKLFMHCIERDFAHFIEILYELECISDAEALEAFKSAAGFGSKQTLRFLFFKFFFTPDERLEAVLAAVQNQQVDILNDIVKYGVNLNALFNQNYNLLHIACEFGDNHINTIKWLISQKVDVNCYANDGTSPLIIAAQKCKSDSIIKLLLQKGAYIEATNTSQESAFTIAFKKGNISILMCLLSYGVKYDLKEIQVHKLKYILENHGSVYNLLKTIKIVDNLYLNTRPDYEDLTFIKYLFSLSDAYKKMFFIRALYLKHDENCPYYKPALLNNLKKNIDFIKKETCVDLDFLKVIFENNTIFSNLELKDYEEVTLNYFVDTNNGLLGEI